MDLQSQFPNCSDLPPVHELKKVNLINTVFTTASLLIQLVLLALLVLYKSWKTTMQKLFLYLTLFTVLNTLIKVCNVELQFDIGPSPRTAGHSLGFCAWIGFFTVWTDVLIELFSISLIFYLIAVTFQKLKRKQLCSFKKNLCSKRQKILMEVVFTCLLVCLPLVFIWWPFTKHLYGKTVTKCWIKSTNDNCMPLNDSNFTKVTTTGIETTLHSTMAISFMALVFTFSLMHTKLRRSRAHNCQTMGRAIFLMVVVGISMVYRICRLVVDQIVQRNPRKVDFFYYALIDNSVYELVIVLVPLGFALYLYSPSKLRITSIKEAAKKWPCYCPKRQPDLLVEEDGPGIHEDSIVRNVPSHTTYTSPHSSPYTNEFTDITDIVGTWECGKPPQYGTIPTIN